MKKTLCICVAFFGFAQSGSFASDNEAAVLGRIGAEEEQAKLACERMKQDERWTKVARKLKERTDIFYKLSPKEKSLLLQHPPSIPNIYGNLSSIDPFMRYSKQIYDSEVSDSRSDFDKSMLKARPLRVIRACKKDLITNVPVHANNERYYSKHFDEDIKFLEESDKNMKAALGGLSKEVLGSPIKLDENLSKLRVLVERQPSFLSFIYFPYHLLIANGDEKISKSIDFDAMLKDIDKDLDKIKSVLGQTSAREQRVSDVKSGDTSAAKSCSEIAVGLIPRDRLGGDYGLAVSKDFQEVLVKPTKEIYAGVGKVIDSGKSVITVVQTEALANKQYVFQLRHDGKTRWFGDRVAHGGYVSFVGRYVDNTTTQLSQGGSTVRIPSRVYDVVCVSSK